MIPTLSASPTEQALQRLRRSTEELRGALDAGDLAAAALILAKRHAELAILQRAASASCLSAAQSAQLGEIVQQGERAVRSLLTRRETARVVLGEIEAVRRLLSNWQPGQTGAFSSLDLSA